jgi:hypothetical protein
MFICKATKFNTKPNESACHLVTHIRHKTYYRKDKYGQDVISGQGQEIVREILVCREYYDKVMAENFQPHVV